MKLITAEIMAQLKKNFKKTIETGESGNIVLKLFGGGSCTWLLTDIDDDGDTLSGLCDIGHGCCEFGTVSLNELQTTKFAFGLGIERDRWFKGGTIEQFQKYYDDHGTLAGC